MYTFIGFDTLCRDCISDFGNNILSVEDDSDKDYLEETEFEVMKELETWRTERNFKCEICGSTNFRIENIRINDHALYKYEDMVVKCEKESLFMFMISLNKRGTEIKLQLGGHSRLSEEFLMGALINIIETTRHRSDQDFTSQLTGYFFICVTGNIDGSDIKIQRYVTNGLTRDEIFHEIKPYASSLNLLVPDTNTSKKSGDHIFEGIKFKGSYLNGFVLEKFLNKNQLIYQTNILYREIDEQNTVAYELQNGEDRKQFYEANKNNEFVIDTSLIKPVNLSNKVVFFCKKVV